MSSSDLSALTGSGSSNQPNRRRRGAPSWLLPILLLLGFVIILALLFGKRLLPAVEVRVAQVVTLRKDSTTPTEESKPEVKTTLLFQASGWIEPDPYLIEVPTLVGGIVKEVFVLEGESVKKGQLLARLIDEDAVLDLRQAETRLATIQAEIRNAQSQIPSLQAQRTAQEKAVSSEKTKSANLRDHYDRLASLPKGSIPTRQLAEARLELQAQESMEAKAGASLPSFDAQIEAARREVEAKQSQLAEAKVAKDRAALALSRHEIRAPQDGVISHLHAIPGKKRMVHMDNPKSATIVELFDPSSLQARIDVPLNEAASLGVGQKVELTTDLLPNLLLKGTVSRIVGEADLQRNTLQTKVSVENPDSRLRPDMLVRAKFFGQASEAAAAIARTNDSRYELFVPESALMGGKVLWIANGDQAELRTVTPGKQKREDHVQILDGVRSGENVILPPHEKMKQGLRVKIVR